MLRGASSEVAMADRAVFRRGGTNADGDMLIADLATGENADVPTMDVKAINEAAANLENIIGN